MQNLKNEDLISFYKKTGVLDSDGKLLHAPFSLANSENYFYTNNERKEIEKIFEEKFALIRNHSYQIDKRSKSFTPKYSWGFSIAKMNQYLNQDTAAHKRVIKKNNKKIDTVDKKIQYDGGTGNFIKQFVSSSKLKNIDSTTAQEILLAKRSGVVENTTKESCGRYHTIMSRLTTKKNSSAIKLNEILKAGQYIDFDFKTCHVAIEIKRHFDDLNQQSSGQFGKLSAHEQVKISPIIKYYYRTDLDFYTDVARHCNKSRDEVKTLINKFLNAKSKKHLRAINKQLNNFFSQDELFFSFSELKVGNTKEQYEARVMIETELKEFVTSKLQASGIAWLDRHDGFIVSSRHQKELNYILREFESTYNWIAIKSEQFEVQESIKMSKSGSPKKRTKKFNQFKLTSKNKIAFSFISQDGTILTSVHEDGTYDVYQNGRAAITKLDLENNPYVMKFDGSEEVQ